MTLCTATDYRRITGDMTPDVATLGDALADAQGLVEEALDRVGLLESAERTETVRVYNLSASYLFLSGLAYPRATPITAVSSPAGVTFTASEVAGISGVAFDVVRDTVQDFPTTTLVYTGGYTAATLPYALKRTICLVARELLVSPTVLASGATSVRTGDTSVTYRAGATPSSGVQAILADPQLMRYRRRRPLR